MGNIMKTTRLTSLMMVVTIGALPALVGCGRSVEAGPPPNMAAALKIRSGFKAAGPAAKTGGGSGGAELKRLEGWATVKRRFIIDGPPAAAAPLAIGKD